MKHRDEPLPRERPRRYVPPAFLSVAAREFLPTPSKSLHADLFDVLSKRRTRRCFGGLSLGCLSSFLWHVAKVIDAEQEDIGAPREHRPMPSAGGCHSIEVLICCPADHESKLFLYDAYSHARVAFENTDAPRMICDAVRPLVDPQAGTVFLLAADCERIGSRYENGESLLWRDSGVLIGGFSLVAEALGLSFCPLGFTADALVSRILDGNRFTGVGGFIVGSRGI